jgi:hypothetical protein
MHHRPLLLAAIVTSAWSAGCQSPPSTPTAHWIPAADAKLVTLGRSTTYALAHHDLRDLLIVEDPITTASATTGRLVWIVPLPADAAMDEPIAVGGSGAEGWLIEQIDGKSSHATPARGEVVLHARTDDQVHATLSLHAGGPPPAAGQPRQTMITINQTTAFLRHEITQPQYAEMRTRSGINR